MDEFKEIHAGKSEDEYTIDVPSGSVADTDVLKDVCSFIVVNVPEAVFHVGVPPASNASDNVAFCPSGFVTLTSYGSYVTGRLGVVATT